MFTTNHETFLNLEEAAEVLGMRTATLLRHPHVYKLGSKKGDEWRFLASRCAAFILEPAAREARIVPTPTQRRTKPVVYMRGRAWYAHLYVDGRRVRRSLGECISEEEASERAVDLQAQRTPSSQANVFISRRTDFQEGQTPQKPTEPIAVRLGGA